MQALIDIETQFCGLNLAPCDVELYYSMFKIFSLGKQLKTG